VSTPTLGELASVSFRYKLQWHWRGIRREFSRQILRLKLPQKFFVTFPEVSGGKE
jgi:hypothetical protein